MSKASGSSAFAPGIGFHQQCSELLQGSTGGDLRAKRDHAIMSVLIGCGLRRTELVDLQMESMQMRQGHWAIVDLVGKGGHIRTVPIPEWVKETLDAWTSAAGIVKGRIFRAVSRGRYDLGQRALRERGLGGGEANL